MNIQLEQLSYIVRVIAHRTGEILKDEWSAKHDVITEFSGRITNETRSKLDNFIIQELNSIYPNHSFIATTDKLLNNSEYKWYIASIDGSKYYYREIPLFSVSIGLLKAGEPVLGAVYNPVSRQMYWGYEDSKTIYRNHSSVKTTPPGRLSECIVGVEMVDYDKLEEDESTWVIKKGFELSSFTYRARYFGCTSLCLAWVATGGLDLFIDLTGKLFEQTTMAGLALIKAAGGSWKYVEVQNGQNRLVAGLSKQLVEEACELIQK
jgi:myo-inositol-1(or 4)-monophosphatase